MPAGPGVLAVETDQRGQAVGRKQDADARRRLRRPPWNKPAARDLEHSVACRAEQVSAGIGDQAACGKFQAVEVDHGGRRVRITTRGLFDLEHRALVQKESACSAEQVAIGVHDQAPHRSNDIDGETGQRGRRAGVTCGGLDDLEHQVAACPEKIAVGVGDQARGAEIFGEADQRAGRAGVAGRKS